MFKRPRPLFAVSLLAFVLALFPSAPRAQTDAPASASSTPDPAKTLDTLSRQLDAIKTTLNGKSISTDELRQLRGDANTLQQQAGQLADGLGPQIDGVKARLTVLGPAPAAGAPPETTQVTQQRKELQREQSKLDSEIKQAQLLGKDAATLTGQITAVRNYQFQTQLATRTGSPLSIGFWTDLAGDFPDDRQHLASLAQSFGDGVEQAWQPGNRMSFLLSLIGAALLLLFGRSLAERAALLLVINRMPDGRFRRSALAGMTTLSVTLSIGLAFWLLAEGLNWHGQLDQDLAGLDQAVVRSAFFAAFLTGLCRSLLSVAHPSWRLPNVLDATAHALRWFPWLLGAGFLLLGTLEHINSAAETSLAMAVTTRAVLALLISGVIGAALLRIKKLKRVASEGEHPAATHAPWVGALGGLATLGVMLAWASVLIGYVAFGFFIAYQMLWIGLIVASYYLLVNLQHDLFSTLLNPKGITGQRLQSSFGLPPHALEQASVLLSGISRVLLLLVAVGTLLMPFGGGPNDLFARIGNVFTDLKFGELSIQPAAIGQAIVVFVLGILAVRVVRRWLAEQLLPKTRLDQGMQMSIVTLLNYVAVVIVFALALKSAHVSLESLTWIASALSVGIGFGLQAIVSNFISGLILLAEQPVKVGDWVSMSGVEGDVKRINVRATEIQLWDRSTMIVPNSQFITQNVRNVTHGNALGRVKITLPMPLSTDVSKMRELMLDALGAHPATLETPAPYIRLDDVSAAGMMFSGVAYVSSPRDAGEVKSDILFDLLGKLDKAQMPLSTPTSMIVRNLGPSDNDSGLGM